MKLNALLTTVILAAPALAVPRGIAERMRARLSHPHQESNAGANIVSTSKNSTVEYSTNWTGAARKSAPPGANYTAVTATFNVPEPTAGPNANGMEGASAWVGIDGDTAGQAILQTGVDFTVDNGQRQYHAWYEWYPDYAHDFTMDVSAGDTIVAMVHSTSPSSGVAIVENKSNGQSATKTLNAPAPTATLVGENAEWIVEDFEQKGKLVDLVNFGTVKFTGCAAEAGGSTYGVSDATIMELVANGQTHSKVQTQGDETMIVKYI
ncbi:Peptidase A4 family [Aspergillus sclerotialis]|uniref:Peptidase A4 family n=1 Tax=Aspergillus sclerotialis TaxID=2070753 RepID=A0A3A2ZF93_9EURO|nr:Peptidase A4 family [Aspergillus sclerotialis]